MRSGYKRYISPGLLGALAMASTTALAQSAATAGSNADDAAGGLEEIVVTAQKREQNLQDVPIAVAALGEEQLKINRVLNLLDLGSVAPGVSVRNAPGGLGAPHVTSRGIDSSGSLPGSDKSISINIDGVYIGAAYGLTNDLLDLVRVEALRGPQGTLFGRNTTGGALSFVTADPTGEFGFRQELSGGNFNHFRSISHLELPQTGAFSGYVSYLHNQRDGDIRNLQSGIVFNRSAAAGYGLETSAKTLGDVETDAARVAVEFAPGDRFKMIYKFDWSKSDNTAGGQGVVAYSPATASGFGLGALNFALNPATGGRAPLLSGTTRPDAVTNAFTTPGESKSSGHTLTATFELNDQMNLKSITAYRKTFAYNAADYSGLGQMFFPGSPTPFYASVSQQVNDHKQTSEELQLNYTSDAVTYTVGGLYFKESGFNGSPDGLTSGGTIFMFPLANNVLPSGRDITYFDGKSWAAFGQVEFHASETLDLVAGARYTDDNKSGQYYRAIPAFGVPLSVSPYKFDGTKTTYLLGANYHLSDDVLLYGKYSTGYISGGSIAGVPFTPETAKSYEVGLKSEFLDRRVRLNVAAFQADYGALQQSVPGSLLARPDLNLALANIGDARAKGLEVELSAVPVDGLTLEAAATYTDFKYQKFTTLWTGTIAAFGGTPGSFPAWLRPKTTVNLGATYESQPLAMGGGARWLVHLDTDYRSEVVTPGIFTSSIATLPGDLGVSQSIYRTGGHWISNARVSLSDISMGSANLEVAAWARNLTDNKGTLWGGYSFFVSSTSYEAARTYGLDIIARF